MSIPGLAPYETKYIKHEPSYHPGRPSYSIKREPSVKQEYPLNDNRNPLFEPVRKLASVKREGADVMRHEYPYHSGSKRMAAGAAELEEADGGPMTYARAVQARHSAHAAFAGPLPAGHVHLTYPSVRYGSLFSSLYV
jgi:hypothetical protein